MEVEPGEPHGRHGGSPLGGPLEVAAPQDGTGYACEDQGVTVLADVDPKMLRDIAADRRRYRRTGLAQRSLDRPRTGARLAAPDRTGERRQCSLYF